MIDHIADLMRPRPMVVFALAFIVGLLLEALLQLGIVVHIGLIVLIVLALFLFKKASVGFSILCLLMAAGGLRMAINHTLPAASLSHLRAIPDSAYQVVAIVSEIGETRRGTPKYTLKPSWVGDRYISHGKILLYAKELEQVPNLGDTLFAALKLNHPRGKRNPHDFDYRNYLETRGVYYEAFIDEQQVVQLFPDHSFHQSRLLLTLKEQIKYSFLKYLKPRTAGVLSALILGERSEVDDETRRNFANTGVIHVLAVSGLHVGYVSLILISIIGVFRLPHRSQTLLVIAGLAFYVLLTGGAASVMRASIMASLILLATILERKTDIFNTLATAAIIILLIDPMQVKSIGFQLSFSAVLSIVTIYPVCRSWIPPVNIKKYPILGKIINGITDLFLVSLSAQLGTLALTMYYFQKVPIISLFANLVVVPLIGLIVSTGMSSLILGSLVPALAELWAALLDGAVDFMLWFVSICASYDWAYLSTRSIASYEVLLLITAIAAISVLSLAKTAKLWLILLLIWGELIIWPDLFRPKQLEVIMLDVGQGDAIVIHTSNGKTMVIDTGLRFGGKDMGRDVISTYLYHRNWLTIDLLVLTHPHNDHIGGAHYLLAHHSVEKVMMQNIEYDSYSYRTLLSTLDSLKIPTTDVYTGVTDSSLAPLYMRATGPKLFDLSSQPSNVNNVSIVSQLFYGKTSVLFTGDAEHEVEADQLAFGDLLRSDLIKAPHHGSKTSSSLPYLEFVNPKISLISLGQGNKYKHPAPITLKHYEDRGVLVHRTDLDGAIHYVSDGKKWTHVDWRNSGR